MAPKREGGWQLDGHDGRPQDCARPALGIGVRQVLLRELPSTSPQDDRCDRHRDPRAELEKTAAGLSKVVDQRQQQLTWSDEKQDPAHEVHEKHRGGELEHSVARPLPRGDVQARRDRRGIEGVGQSDDHDDADQARQPYPPTVTVSLIRGPSSPGGL